jgi:transketolase
MSIDGNDLEAISEAVDAAKATRNGKPTVIVAETVKGKGVSFMENQVGWHGVAPTAEQAEAALAEILGA